MTLKYFLFIDYLSIILIQSYFPKLVNQFSCTIKNIIIIVSLGHLIEELDNVSKIHVPTKSD